jgi:hypothetical protein
LTPIPLTPPVTLTPEALANLARYCHADSVAAGWWEPLEPAADTARKAMRADLIGSEVGEALDALRRPERPLAYLDDKGKPDGYLVEVADTAIRALDLLGRVIARQPVEPVFVAWVALGMQETNPDSPRLTVWHHLVWYALLWLPNKPKTDNLSQLFTIRRLSCIVDLCANETAAHGADLVTLINLKRAFNRTRGTRHGGMSV